MLDNCEKKPQNITGNYCSPRAFPLPSASLLSPSMMHRVNFLEIIGDARLLVLTHQSKEPFP